MRETLIGLMLFAVGIPGGFVSAVAGGSNVITFPVLQFAGISSPIAATASNMAAISPANPLATIKVWRLLPRLDWVLVGLMLIAGLGAILGTQLLLAIPEAKFRFVVPVLLGGGTLVFAYSRQIRDWLTDAFNNLIKSSPRTGRELSPGVIQLILYVPVAIYGGFWGAGQGLLTLAVLSVGLSDARRANAAKNLINSVTIVVATVSFSAAGAVSWSRCLWMMPGVAIGGVIGGWFIQKAPEKQLRGVIIVIGIVVTLMYILRYWFGMEHF